MSVSTSSEGDGWARAHRAGLWAAGVHTGLIAGLGVYVALRLEFDAGAAQIWYPLIYLLPLGWPLVPLVADLHLAVRAAMGDFVYLVVFPAAMFALVGAVQWYLFGLAAAALYRRWVRGGSAS